MHLTFSSDIECSISERTISGKIVPFGGEIGHTSAGKVIFEIPHTAQWQTLIIQIQNAIQNGTKYTE